MIEDYGDAIVTRQADGSLAVDSAADRIGVAVELLASIGPEHFRPGGMLVLDTAGEYVYRPFGFARDGKVVVCCRVDSDEELKLLGMLLTTAQYAAFTRAPDDVRPSAEEQIAAAHEYMQRYYARLQEPSRPGDYLAGGQLLSGLTAVVNDTDEPEQVNR